MGRELEASRHIARGGEAAKENMLACNVEPRGSTMLACNVEPRAMARYLALVINGTPCTAAIHPARAYAVLACARPGPAVLLA